ncbi:thioredoxin family protein [Pedobacter sp. MC2016-24]|uniref:thioredoxin family protein n=1 Tax=Pedobacter sp. MC2016-24 TaxID=2780090 RepID=UPI00187EC970|nr:thioredoxin family protein [Pedobacter sp. MC2016-24]MBE9601550.1 thioredoxin family protein [Pedobacter sp. MC2016-24]
MKKILLPLLLFTYCFAMAQNRKINFDAFSFKEAFERSKIQGKLVFVDCYTVWCGPCKQMEAGVFKTDSVADFFNSNFINLKLDMEKGEGPAALKTYNVGAFPSYLLLDNLGKVVYKFVGGMSADKFMTHIRKGMKPGNEVEKMNARYTDGERDHDFLREYVLLKIRMSERIEAKQINNELMTIMTPKERALRKNWVLFGENRYAMYLSDVGSPNFKYLVGHWKDFLKEVPKDTIDKKMSAVLRKTCGWTMNGFYFKEFEYKRSDFEEYKKQIKLTEMPDKEQLLVLMDVAIAASEKNPELVTDLLVANIASFSEDNRRILFEYISMCSTIKGYNYPKIVLLADEVIKSSSNSFLINTFTKYKIKYATSNEN